MKLLFTLLFIIPQLFAIIGSVMYGDFISIKDAPFFISFLSQNRTDNKYHCGGSIISEHWIITAAHCLQLTYDRISTGEGLPNVQNSSSTYDIEKIFVHGNYIDAKYGRDVALIKLKEPIEFDEYRQPIKIRKIPPKSNETVILLGLGDQGSTKGMAPVLKRTKVQVVSKCVFLKVHKSLRGFAFCAGNGTTDVCGGDSGGPAIINGELAGLVSFGPPCHILKEHSHLPGVYTRLDALYDWIVKITGREY